MLDNARKSSTKKSYDAKWMHLVARARAQGVDPMTWFTMNHCEQLLNQQTEGLDISSLRVHSTAISSGNFKVNVYYVFSHPLSKVF